MLRSLRPAPLSALALGALLSATTACHDRGATAPDRPAPPRETTLIAAAGGKSAANDVLLVQAISAALGGGSARSLSLRPTAPRGAPSMDITYGGLDCTYNSSRSLFECPQVTLESMTIRAEFALYDASKNPQSAYDDVTTTSATVWYWAWGTLVNPPGGATIDRQRTLTVDNLQSGASERVFGGGGTDVSNGTLPDDATKTFVLHDTTTAAGVAVGVPFSANVWPLRGTLTTNSQLDIAQGGSTISTTHRRVVITFNGTQFVPMDVDGTVYTLDLGTGDLTPNP